MAWINELGAGACTCYYSIVYMHMPQSWDSIPVELALFIDNDHMIHPDDLALMVPVQIAILVSHHLVPQHTPQGPTVFPVSK